MKRVSLPRFFNREISWLAFNRRVLDEGRDAGLPLLERLKFLAITASNLDEFYMVRVGGLKMLVAERVRRCDLSGLTPRQQLNLVMREIRRLAIDQYALYRELIPKLAEHGLRILDRAEALSPEQLAWAVREFDDVIFPLLSPVALSPLSDYHPAGLRLHCAVRLAPQREGEDERLALIPIGPNVPRFLRVPGSAGAVYVPVEVVVSLRCQRFFERCEVLECVPFRVTRNADIELREDVAPDLLVGMQELLDERRETVCTRLEIHRSASQALIRGLRAYFGLEHGDVYPGDGPVDLRALLPLSQVEGFESLRDEQWQPVASASVDLKEPIFAQIAERDILLIHPYEAFDPVVKFVEDAAQDPDVLAIKQVLYRTAPNSQIIEALIQAAQAGKHVTVLIELKARFDEARNIAQAQRLERAGVQVIYGVRGLKTHAKICLVMRREREGVTRYVHFGTGNYNERTAALYSDVGYMTCRPELGADATDFFNAITGYSQPQSLRRLEMSPFTLRPALLRLIANEAARAGNRERALIMLKMNALTDEALIEALYAASRAGVKVRLNIRGICCLRPGVRGLSENITVVSVVDRFLEHARLFYFLDGGRGQMYMSSADGMPRNLDKRVELMVPVQDEASRKRLLKVLKLYFKDNVKAHMLLPDGIYHRLRSEAGAARVRSQKALYEDAQAAARAREQLRPTMLVVHKKRASRR